MAPTEVAELTREQIDYSQDGIQRLYRQDDDITRFVSDFARLETMLIEHGLPVTKRVIEVEGDNRRELTFYGAEGDVQVLYAREGMDTNSPGLRFSGEQTTSVVGRIPAAVLDQLEKAYSPDIPNGALPEGVLLEPHKISDYTLEVQEPETLTITALTKR